MKPIALQTLIDFADGSLRQGDGGRLVSTVTTDSRKVAPGDVFVALVGDRFDAHAFIPQVAAAGAAAVVVSNSDPAWQDLPCAVITVPDTLKALQDMARGYRAWHGARIIGLTGSNGKTSTKDLTALVMGRQMQTRATEGNLNNHVGLPLTLLRLAEGDECGVVEMGMNHPGEIKTLADIAMPDAAIVTNIGFAHMEFMGSQDAIAWEKGTLPANVHPDGIVVLNANDAYTPVIARHCQAQVYTAGTQTGDVRAFDLRGGAQGTTFKLDFAGDVQETFLPVLGEHMVANAALAACMGWAHGIAPAEIADSLRHAKLTGGRMETKTVNGVLIIDDSYNANPDSMRAGLATLARADIRGRSVAVLGRMSELGPQGPAEHRKIGEYAASLAIDAVYSVGDDAAPITDAARAAGHRQALHCSSHQECADRLREFLQPGDAVLLKGSRSAAMEGVLTHLNTP